MLTLAVDQSTAVNSVALLDGEAVLWETRWTRAEARGPQLVAVIEAALAGLGRAPAQIEAFAVGVGPGSYSGLRMSISAVRAWALPGGRPVCGVSSAEALARDAMDETGARTAAVAGDARRGRLWLGRAAWVAARFGPIR